MANNQFLGFLDISINGATILSGADATFEPGGVTRSARKTNRVVGWSQEVQESKATVNIAINSAFSIDAYRNLTGATLTFTADTGQVWTVGAAWCSAPPSINQKDGMAKVEFTGPPATEILTSAGI